MKPKAKPICDFGERNLDCPLYEDCLDLVVARNWECWSCSFCPYKHLRTATTESVGGPNHEIAYYEVNKPLVEAFELD